MTFSDFPFTAIRVYKQTNTKQKKHIYLVMDSLQICMKTT